MHKFLRFIFGIKLYMFWTVPLSIIRSFSLYTQQWYMSYRFADSRCVWHITLLCVQWKTPDDGQRNCPTHVEFYSKNKFEKLVHLVGFILRKYYPRSPHLVLLFCLEQYRPLHFGNLQAWPDVSGADLPPRNLVLQIGDALLVKGCLALS